MVFVYDFDFSINYHSMRMQEIDVQINKLIELKKFHSGRIVELKKERRNKKKGELKCLKKKKS